MTSADYYPGTRERDALIRLHEVNHQLASEPDAPRLLWLILDHAIAFTRAERGFLILKGLKGLELRAARAAERQELAAGEFAFPRSVIEAVLNAGQPVLISNALEDPQFNYRDSVRALGHASVACIPLRLGGQAAGVIYLDHRLRRALFRSEDMLVLETFADLASGALEAARLRQKVSEQQEELKLLSAQVEHARKKGHP